METTARSNTAFPAGSNNSGDGALGKAVVGAHDAVTTAAKLADEVILKAKPVIDRVAESAHQAVTKAAGVAAPTAEWLSEQSAHIKSTQQKVLSDARHHVTANPLKAVAIALTAGLLIGRLLR